jgi:predicted ATP-dependent endonuclease of OLD family
MSDKQNNTNRIGIGFNNFRKFKEFPTLDFGNITYMVGRNNAGKSTMVKALLLVKDYINNQFGDSFSFDSNALNDANIVTYGRAHCKSAKDPFIDFSIHLKSYECNIRISGEEDQTKADVNYIEIKDSLSGIDFKVDYLQNEVSLKFTHNKSFGEENQDHQLQSLRDEIRTLRNQLAHGMDKRSREGLVTIDRINRLEAMLPEGSDESNEDSENNEEFEISYPLRSISEIHTEDNGLMEIVSDFLDLNHREYRNMIEVENEDNFENENDKNIFKDRFENIKSLYNQRNEIKQIFYDFINSFQKEKFHYLGANPTKQSALFPLRDKENALAQAIHEYHQHSIKDQDFEARFVRKWMKEFEVGDEFEIKFYAGEAYRFYIKQNGHMGHLSDKGMGSLQAMMLILRVASLMRENKKMPKNITLIVEEPELNLHPALQSKLTDFFHEVSTMPEAGFKLIIETHSEYMIRKTQVIVNIEEYGDQESINPNPFKVYYYPKDNPVYEMKYRADGKFTSEFNSGFFDVSTELAFDII